MNIRQCLIVEDSEPFQMLLENYLKRFPLFQVVKICETYSEAVDILSSEKIDVVFLDVELPDISGLELLRSFPNMPPTVITTSHPKYAIESYEIGRAVDYLLKPFTFERFTIAVNRALGVSMSKHSFQDQDFIVVKMGRTLQRFNLDEIAYIEAYTIYSKIYCHGSSYVVNEIISALEKQLDAHRFMRIHKSYIINIKKITSVDTKQVWLDKISIPIGKSYKPQLEGLLRLFNKDDDTEGGTPPQA
jgi:two-component system, LytTR family, response regulator LytT